MSSNDALTKFQTTITSSATRLANLTNLAAGPTAVVGFLAEGVFKGIRLGLQIRAKAREVSAKLDNTIRARSFVRNPIEVNLTELSFRNFFENSANLAAFPVLQEMAPELEEFKATEGFVSSTTRDRLEVARALAVPLTNDPQLLRPENAELREMFQIGMDPNKRTFRNLVQEYLELYPDREMTVKRYQDLAADFWREKLALEVKQLDTLQIAAQQELNQAISQLVREAFLGDDGFALKALGLAKNLKKLSIEGDIAELQRELATAPASKKASIQARIDNLNAWKARLGA